MIQLPDELPGVSLADVAEASDSVSVETLNSEPYASRVSAVLAMLAKVSRAFNGREIKLSSVVRSVERNASLPNASPYSHHVAGWAADFYVPGVEPRVVWEAIRALQPYIRFDELGLYDTHVHISADPRARGKVFDKRSQPEAGGARTGSAALRVVVVLFVLLAVVSLAYSLGG